MQQHDEARAAEIRQLEQDHDRLNWLECQARREIDDPILIGVFKPGGITLAWCDNPYTYVPFAEGITLRDAIDAARETDDDLSHTR